MQGLDRVVQLLELGVLVVQPGLEAVMWIRKLLAQWIRIHKKRILINKSKTLTKIMGKKVPKLRLQYFQYYQSSIGAEYIYIYKKKKIKTTKIKDFTFNSTRLKADTV